MACNIPMSSVIEEVHGLPRGTIAKIGGEAAADLAVAIQRDPHDPLVVAMVAALTRNQGGPDA